MTTQRDGAASALPSESHMDLADRIAHAIDAIHHTAVRNPRDGGARMRRAKDVLIGIVSGVVADRDAATAEILRLRAEVERLRQQAPPAPADGVPSDEEIREAIQTVQEFGYGSTAKAIRLVAKRAGVKL